MFFFVFVGLVFLIAVSKEFLVFNAETLVLITFVLFICMLIVQLKSSVVDFFDNRAAMISKEITVSREEFKKVLLELKHYLSEDFFLLKTVYSFLVFLKYAHWVAVAYSEFLLNLKIHLYIEEQLNRVELLENRIFFNLMKSVQGVLLYRVSVFFNSQTKKQKDSILSSSISALR